METPTKTPHNRAPEKLAKLAQAVDDHRALLVKIKDGDLGEAQADAAFNEARQIRDAARNAWNAKRAGYVAAAEAVQKQIKAESMNVHSAL